MLCKGRAILAYLKCCHISFQVVGHSIRSQESLSDCLVRRVPPLLPQVVTIGFKKRFPLSIDHRNLPKRLYLNAKPSPFHTPDFCLLPEVRIRGYTSRNRSTHVTVRHGVIYMRVYDIDGYRR